FETQHNSNSRLRLSTVASSFSREKFESRTFFHANLCASSFPSFLVAFLSSSSCFLFSYVLKFSLRLLHTFSPVDSNSVYFHSFLFFFLVTLVIRRRVSS